jgi:hypothetical protein
MRSAVGVPARRGAPVLVLLLAAALVVPAMASAAWTAVPPAYTGNENAALSYDDRGTLTELDTDAGLPGGVWHARSRPAGGVFGPDFELPFLLPLTATRPDGTEALVGMDSAGDVHTALRADAATSFAVSDEHSTSQTYPPAGISTSSSGAGLTEWIDGGGHVQVAGLAAAGSSFGPPTAALPGNPVQQVTFLSVVHPVLDPSGAAVLTWATSADSVHYQLQQSTRASAAGPFGAPTPVGPDIEVEPQLVANRAGDAAAVWWTGSQLEAAVRRPGGAFGGATPVATPTGTFDRDSLQAGVMGDGTVVVLWREYAGPHSCADGGNAGTLHVDTLAPGGTWQAAEAGSTENEAAVGPQEPVLAVSQSTFAVADVLAENQGAASCGSGTKRVYAWQGAPGTFDGDGWALLPGQSAAVDSTAPAIAADPQGDVTVTWLVGSDRFEATSSGAGDRDGGGDGGTANGGGGGGGGGGGTSEGGPQRFGPNPAPNPAPSTGSATEAVTLRTVTVIAFNVGLGRAETVEMPISCVSDAPCNVMAEAAIRLFWGTPAPQSRARSTSKAKHAENPVTIPLPRVKLHLAARAKGRLAIKVPKSTMKRLEALLRRRGAKATLTVKLRVNGVIQEKGITARLRLRKADPGGAHRVP